AIRRPLGCKRNLGSLTSLRIDFVYLVPLRRGVPSVAVSVDCDSVGAFRSRICKIRILSCLGIQSYSCNSRCSPDHPFVCQFIGVNGATHVTLHALRSREVPELLTLDVKLQEISVSAVVCPNVTVGIRGNSVCPCDTI